MEKLLSIIVPTKNRYTYLKGLIKIFINCNSHKTELIIQDNSTDNSEFKEYMKNIDCNDIRYFYESKPLSVVDNMNQSIEHSTGKYLCILGDDDVYSIYLEDFVKYMDESGIDSAMFSNDSVYFWPGMEFAVHQLPSLMIPKFHKTLKKLSASEERDKCLRMGGMSLGYLPRVYHGVICRSAMEKVNERAGTYFPGASPDMASSIALSYYVKTHCYCELPLVISGKSPKSVVGKEGHHPAGEIKNVDHLPKNTEENWPVSLPKFWSAGTIWAQSLFEAMIKLGHEDELKNFSYASCYANVAVFERTYRKMLTPFLKGHYLLRIRFMLVCIKLLSLRCKVFIKNFALTRFHITNMNLHNHVEDSLEASRIIDTYIKSIVGLEI